MPRVQQGVWYAALLTAGLGGQAQPRSAPLPPPLARVLRRGDDRACATFPRHPHGWLFISVSRADQDEVMRWIARRQWVSADPDDRSGTRCVLSGPHNDLNLRNWCCR